MRFYGLALLMICVNAAAGGSAEQAAVTITVEPSNTHAISPFIYGVNIATTIEHLPPSLTLDRTGGNRWTAYNWETNASNAGSDYQYQNDASLSSSKEAGAAVTTLIASDQKAGMASMLTVQMQGLVAGDVDGPVSLANPPDRKRFKKVFYEKKSVTNDPFTVKPPASDDYVYMDEFIWAVEQKFSGQDIFSARPKTQPVFVSLDNEPELWKSTHLEIQGKSGIAADPYIARTLSLTTALKKQFPELVIFGPAHYGFLGLYNWNGEMSASPSGRNWFADKYLAAVKAASVNFGKPLVDVYDFHWYPEATDSGGARITTLMGSSLSDDQVQAIVQSPRSLWDKSYKEKSWIAKDVIGGPIDILDRLQSRIDAENPGMRLAITEYNNGGGQHIAGTIAQADNLGIFGERGLFAATWWPLSQKEPYSLAGYRAFRNFDGANHHFGDISVRAESSNAAQVVVYVSTDSGHAGRVVMVAINRSPAEQEAIVRGQPLTGSAHLFQMSAATAAKQSAIQPVAVGTLQASGSAISLKLPPLSVTTVDIY